MNQTAVILNQVTLYWYSIILALSIAAGVCIFMACCGRKGVSSGCGAAAALLSVVFSVVLSRLIYWYCHPFRFAGFRQALTTPAADSFALLGAFLGCFLAAFLLQRAAGGLGKLLDCMSVAGCGAIALGRLAFFFSDGDRGRVLADLTHLPWAYPIINPTTVLPEYRLATFVFQSAVASVLFLVLLFVFRSKRASRGGATLLFLMVYGASQIVLDSTRYYSLYLRSNGFISMVQSASAAAMLGSIAWVSICAARKEGVKRRMARSWLAIAALFGGAGYMEYFVQRHGKLAAYGYTAMTAFLTAVVILGITLWRKGMKAADSE